MKTFLIWQDRVPPPGPRSPDAVGEELQRIFAPLFDALPRADVRQAPGLTVQNTTHGELRRINNKRLLGTAAPKSEVAT